MTAHRYLCVLAALLVPQMAANAQDIEPITVVPALAPVDGVLLPETLLERSARHFPDILASFEREAAARGEQLAANGAFDLVFKADSFSRATGFWSGSVVSTEARQRLRNRGAEIYGGYRLSDGRFPVYEDEYFTNSLGEFKLGALFSLLRDRTIDQQRFGVDDARLAAQQASLDVVLTQLGVQHQALKSYWKWVAAGREVGIYRDLLEIAEARQTGLKRQVNLGALASIALVENQQNILKRQRLVAEAERNFTMAGNILSFYFRDQRGLVTKPTVSLLPNKAQLDPLPDMAQVLKVRSSDILDSRPELRQFRIAVERARNKVSLRENDLKPQLDFSLEVSRDFGAIAEGGRSRDSTDAIVGLNFSVPLQRRAARGKLSQAEAELREIELREQQTAEQILFEVENILVDLKTALDIVELADNEFQQAQKMVNAERRRFTLGAGDFFLINLREEAAADAQVRALQAEFTSRLAAASYDAVTMNFENLGLTAPLF